MNWKIINQFRSGHCELNAQNKVSANKICTCCTENKLETIEHFVFECCNWNIKRDKFMEEINTLYNIHFEERFNTLSDEVKLCFMLFPFQDIIEELDLSEDRIEIDYYLKQRVKVLYTFADFVKLRL